MAQLLKANNQKYSNFKCVDYWVRIFNMHRTSMIWETELFDSLHMKQRQKSQVNQGF